jgi:SAM-dependent methyltransferase
LKQRIDVPERMEAPGLDPTELRGALDHVASVNRWLGGLRSLKRALRPWVAGQADGAPRSSGHASTFRILDVGTGNGDVPVRLLRWASARQRAWMAVGVDLHPRIIRIAGERGARSGTAGCRPRFAAVRADGMRLPFPDGSFDVVLTVLTLHHFDDAAAVRLLREMARVARRLVVVSDLERRRSALLGAHLLALTVWRRSPVTRHDGPLSVRRSFTREELLRLGEEAGLHLPTVRRHLPFRLLLTGEPRKAEVRRSAAREEARRGP